MDEHGFNKALGKRIRTRRKLMGLNQAALGERCGMSRGTISRYENGKVSIPMPRLAGIAEVLGLEVDALFDGAIAGDGDANAFSHQMKIGKRIMAENREVLAKLAE